MLSEALNATETIVVPWLVFALKQRITVTARPAVMSKSLSIDSVVVAGSHRLVSTGVTAVNAGSITVTELSDFPALESLNTILFTSPIAAGMVPYSWRVCV